MDHSGDNSDTTRMTLWSLRDPANPLCVADVHKEGVSVWKESVVVMYNEPDGKDVARLVLAHIQSRASEDGVFVLSTIS